jgi:hypothetical protein
LRGEIGALEQLQRELAHLWDAEAIGRNLAFTTLRRRFRGSRIEMPSGKKRRQIEPWPAAGEKATS